MIEELNKIEDVVGLKLETFNLINNYGFTFTKNDYEYQITHRTTSYGCECDTWDLLDKDLLLAACSCECEECYRNDANFYDFNTLDDLLEKLNELLDRRDIK